jgi:hypothetical protein
LRYEGRRHQLTIRGKPIPLPRWRRHFLAAGHLALVLADDYEQVGETELAIRSRLSAGSCFWRGGR